MGRTSLSPAVSDSLPDSRFARLQRVGVPELLEAVPDLRRDRHAVVVHGRTSAWTAFGLGTRGRDAGYPA